MSRKKILIIDDEKDFTNIVKSNLEETGRYNVKAENRGDHGLAAAREFNPDLILMDLVMPGMDGSIVVQQIKEDSNISNIPIVFLTAVVKKESDSDSNIIGGHRFLSKPVDIEELAACIDESISMPR